MKIIHDQMCENIAQGGTPVSHDITTPVKVYGQMQEDMASEAHLYRMTLPHLLKYMANCTRIWQGRVTCISPQLKTMSGTCPTYLSQVQ